MLTDNNKNNQSIFNFDYLLTTEETNEQKPSEQTECSFMYIDVTKQHSFSFDFVNLLFALTLP